MFFILYLRFLIEIILIFYINNINIIIKNIKIQQEELNNKLKNTYFSLEHVKKKQEELTQYTLNDINNKQEELTSILSIIGIDIEIKNKKEESNRLETLETKFHLNIKKIQSELNSLDNKLHYLIESKMHCTQKIEQLQVLYKLYENLEKEFNQTILI